MPSSLKVPRVLVVDAEPYICRVFEAKLTKDRQFQVACAMTGPEAFQAAVEQVFDIVLWDTRLWDSASMLPQVRALCPHASLVLMTTDDNPRTTLEMARLDVAETLVKPFGLDTLVGHIYRALNTETRGGSVAQIEFGAVGQQVTIVSPAGRCQSRVLANDHNAFSVVGAPRVDIPADFVPGLPVRIEIKGANALYRFDSRLLREIMEPIACWQIELPGLIYREQRRLYPRYPLKLPICLNRALSASSDSAAEAAQPVVNGFTEDISLTGCVLVGEQTLSPGAAVRFDIAEPAGQRIEGTGTIVRAERMSAAFSPESRPRYRLVLQFGTLDPDHQFRLRRLLTRSA